MSLRGYRWAVLAAAVVWGAISTVSALVFAPGAEASIWSAAPPPLPQAAAWLLGGLATGLLLRWANRALPWNHVLPLAVTWGLAGLLPWYTRLPMVGLLTVFALRRTDRTVGWQHSLIIAGGWVAAGAPAALLTGAVEPPALTAGARLLIAALGGLFFGAVGAGVMLAILRLLGRGGPGPVSARRRPLREVIAQAQRTPIMARLRKRNIERQLYSFIGVAFGIGIAILVISMSVWARVRTVFNVQSSAIPLLIYLVALAPTVRSPLVIASLSALLTGADTSKQQFRLLRTTLLRQREVAWAYALAPLQLARGFLTFEYIVMLLMLASAACAYIPALLLASERLVVGAGAVLLMWSVTMFGMNLLASAVGVRAALWLRQPQLAAPVAVGATLAAVLAGLLVGIEGLRRLAAQPGGPPASLITGFFFLMLLPYAITVELNDTARLWVQPGSE